MSAIEHPAVLESAEFLGRLGYEVTILDVDHDGMVQPDALAAALRDDTTLVSIQYANNEVGTIQPIETLAALAAERGRPVPHRRGAGRRLARPRRRTARRAGHEHLGAQARRAQGHRRPVRPPRHRFEPLIHGGGQESGRRSGTENVAAAVGMAAALRLAGGSNDEIVARRDAFIDRVLAEVPGAELTGHRDHRLPGSASFVFPGTNGETILLELEARGIVCSSGSACAAGSDEPSHVLTAMGYAGPVAQTAVRFTFGRTTTAEDLDTAATELVRAVAAVSALG